MASVVGRDPELAAIERFLDTARSRVVGLVLEGEAGIGKTTVWREAVRVAEERGYTVLRSRPAEAEATLAFTALADLLEPVGEDVFSELPDPQKHALEVALLRTSPRRPVSHQRAVATGVLSLLRALAGTPVVVAIDDAQWLDRSSATALSFALRRLDAESPIAVLMAVRLENGQARTPLAVQDARGSAKRVRLGPLSLSALYHVIRAELDLVFPRPTLQRIEQVSGGNPLFAVELARVLEEHGGRPGPGEPLPVSGELLELLGARIQRLPAGSREALLAAALSSAPTTPLLERTLGPSAPRALERAARADVIERRGERVRFRHPLLAEAVSSSVHPEERRAMHRRLARVVANVEQRARHLALGADGPDEHVAGSLEEAARLATQRGAPEEAAELLELACRLTPQGDDGDRARLRLSLAEAVGRSGDAREAAHILDSLLGKQTAGPLRARALELRAQIHWVAGTTVEAEACCEEALTCVGDDDELRARVLVTLARITLDAELLYERAQSALALLDRLPDPDPGLVSEALVAVAGAEYSLGHGIPMDVVQRGLKLERVAPPANVGDRMSAALGAWLKYDGDLEEARHWLEATRRAAIEEGDEGSLPYSLSHLPQLELWTGNWEQAETRAMEHLELAERTGQSLERLTAIYNLSLVEAHRGRIEEVRARLEPALAEAEGGEPWNVYLLLSVLGFVELSVGRHSDAVAALGRAFDIYESTGAGDTPSVFENYPEALVASGELGTAEDVVDLFEARARAANKAMALAPALRCRALLLAARQRLDDAATALDEALAHHEQVAMPFSRARTLLVVGQVRRRRGERRAAKDALEQALAIFDDLGAPLWAERVRAELGRVPIRRRAATDELTPTEERVAELVAQGKTNREVAHTLFVSQKTVEANLTRIYRKLEVHSRTALAARLTSPIAEGRQPEP